MIEAREAKNNFLLRTNTGKAIPGKGETACVNKLIGPRNWSNLLWMDHRLFVG